MCLIGKDRSCFAITAYPFPLWWSVGVVGNLDGRLTIVAWRFHVFAHT